ncbi:MAG: single-stranded DNA-binding protein [Rikenellaceae bacterium]|nr:single-stranded DNA-binding protein [Rikenellaceae bacterium]
MLNKAQVIGNLGADPKVSIINNGQTKVASFSVATTDRGYTTQLGVQVPDKTEWHNIVCFGKLADVVDKFLKKGSKVFIEGKMRTRSYEDKSGVKRSVMEINADTIEMLDSKQQSQQPQVQPQPQAQYSSQGNGGDGDLPF